MLKKSIQTLESTTSKIASRLGFVHIGTDWSRSRRRPVNVFTAFPLQFAAPLDDLSVGGLSGQQLQASLNNSATCLAALAGGGHAAGESIQGLPLMQAGPGGAGATKFTCLESVLSATNHLSADGNQQLYTVPRGQPEDCRSFTWPQVGTGRGRGEME